MTFEEEVKQIIARGPKPLDDPTYRYDAFDNGEVLHGKRRGYLPAMGWNSWNAFGSGNTEELTRQMAHQLIELELDKLGYHYLVLDDGCYYPERVDGKITNDPEKFPSGFKALADELHGMGLKFGMYNDIGTNLCAGAAVGTCGHEKTDAKCYAEWEIDFLKVDNCYYLWDNATFSDAANAKYVYTPAIRKIFLSGHDISLELSAVEDGILSGEGGIKAQQEDSVWNLGTFDGTGPDASPIGVRSAELTFRVNVSQTGKYQLTVCYANGQENGKGRWLQIAVGRGKESRLYYDAFMPETPDGTDFVLSPEIEIELKKGENLIRLMNHRRQENTLHSYDAMLEGLMEAAPDREILLSICEWGKTQPQNWGYKVGHSWRILNDITFRVGADGDPGHGAWTEDYTTSVTSQYNKCVIMDEFAGKEKGWNDPDMMMIGMEGLNETMCKTHMTMWCMMNAPLMLGMDLRRMKKGDALHKIVSNADIISLDQDALGIQAKRIYASNLEADSQERPDQAYIRENDRVDILAKPLADGSVAISFINVGMTDRAEGWSTDKERILTYIGDRMIHREAFQKAERFRVTDLWSGEVSETTGGLFAVQDLKACDNVTIKVTPIS